MIWWMEAKEHHKITACERSHERGLLGEVGVQMLPLSEGGKIKRAGRESSFIL